MLLNPFSPLLLNCFYYRGVSAKNVEGKILPLQSCGPTEKLCSLVAMEGMHAYIQTHKLLYHLLLLLFPLPWETDAGLELLTYGP